MKIATDERSYALIRSGNIKEVKKMVGVYHQEILNPATQKKEWILSVLTRWEPSIMNPAIDKILSIMATDVFLQSFENEVRKNNNENQILVQDISFEGSTNTLTVVLHEDDVYRTEKIVLDFSKELNEQISHIYQLKELPDVDSFIG